MFVLFLIISVVIPGTLAFLGLLWKKHPPKEINDNYGHRTEMSMKNQETWDFAHKNSQKICLHMGITLSIISVATIILFRKNDNALCIVIVILLVIQLICVLLATKYTENALKKVFDKNGNRKNDY